MKLGLKIFLCAWVLLFGFCACEDDDDEPETPMVNQWVYDLMNQVYLWDYTLKEVNPKAFPDTESFFYDQLVYTAEDKWSYITNDYAALIADLDGSPLAMGYSYTLGRISDTDNLFMVIKYVYPGSPAQRAGLKRGDFVLEIDGTALDENNYKALLSQTNYSVSVGKFSVDQNKLVDLNKTIALSAEVIEADPAIFNKVIDVEGKKIGYLVYVQFTGGEEDKYLGTLDNIFDQFVSEGVSELIVDLRYNPGGSIATAQYLASAIAPKAVVTAGEDLVTCVYNDKIMANQGQYSSELGVKFSYEFVENDHNMDLSRVCFLTTGGSASASELITIGLKPYMEVLQIGENTYGKYTGSWVLADYEQPSRHNWAMMPIVMKYANVDGLSDFKEGLTPDFEVADELFPAVPFGNVSDPLLATALNKLTGFDFPVLKSTKFQQQFVEIETDEERRKRTLVL